MILLLDARVPLCSSSSSSSLPRQQQQGGQGQGAAGSEGKGFGSGTGSEATQPRVVGLPGCAQDRRGLGAELRLPPGGWAVGGVDTGPATAISTSECYSHLTQLVLFLVAI